MENKTGIISYKPQTGGMILIFSPLIIAAILLITFFRVVTFLWAWSLDWKRIKISNDISPKIPSFLISISIVVFVVGRIYGHEIFSFDFFSSGISFSDGVLLAFVILANLRR